MLRVLVGWILHVSRFHLISFCYICAPFFFVAAAGTRLLDDNEDDKSNIPGKAFDWI